MKITDIAANKEMELVAGINGQPYWKTGAMERHRPSLKSPSMSTEVVTSTAVSTSRSAEL